MVQAAFQEAQHTLNDDPNYRPMSGLAVAGFLTSLGSVAAFFGMALWPVAAMAAALCVAGMYHVKSTDPPRAGGRLAKTGLALSLFCLVAAASYDSCYGWLLRQQGDRVVTKWIDALDGGRIAEAHQLTLWPQDRLPRGKKLNQTYQNDLTRAEQLEQFENTQAIRRFLALADRQVTLRHAGPPVRSAENERIAYVYQVRGKKKDGRKADFELKIDILRPTSQTSSIAGWRVRSYHDEPPEFE